MAELIYFDINLKYRNKKQVHILRKVPTIEISSYDSNTQVWKLRIMKQRSDSRKLKNSYLLNNHQQVIVKPHKYLPLLSHSRVG
ncbi:unnamed protein product [Paramecium octaurelia]|uniref:Uncharacterized protein n=1 Tax=Paramecium octaurelia TaxID=43137 RepID=A0A8S1UZJ4_PAROT|nr:unnamed protein product [Paramecium octaurelia]